MKGNNLILLAVLGIGAYFLLSRKTSTSISSQALSAKAATQAATNSPIPTSAVPIASSNVTIPASQSYIGAYTPLVNTQTLGYTPPILTNATQIVNGQALTYTANGWVAV